MEMDNEKIKVMLKNNGIPYWKLADELGVSENTVMRMMRKPLSEDKATAVKAAVLSIKAKRGYDDEEQ